MSDEEIRGAVEILKRDQYWGENENVKAFETILSLAQRYLSIKCPEIENIARVIYEAGFLSAPKDLEKVATALSEHYRLFNLKEDERKEEEFKKKLEGLGEVILDSVWNIALEQRQNGKVDAFNWIESVSGTITTALQTYLMDKERG